MRNVARPLALASLFALSLASSPVAADASPLPPPGQYGSLGLNLGWAAHPVVSSGGQLGGELSLPHLFQDIFWVGPYADVLRDFGEHSTKWSFGPEFGAGPFGVDGGLLIRTGDAAAKVGFQVRGILTFALVAIYVGYARVPNDLEDNGFAQLGLLLKLPFPIWEDEHSRWRPGPNPPPVPPPPPAPEPSSSTDVTPPSPPPPTNDTRFATPPPP